MSSPADEVRRAAARYRRIVVWGLNRHWHSHRFIHQGFVDALRRLGIPVLWTDYTDSPDVLEAGDLVITSNAHGRGTRGTPLAPFREGASYVFHGFPAVPHPVPPERRIFLEVFTRAALAAPERWDASTCYDPESRTLYQAWGTNLFAEDFRPPVTSRLPVVFWVGAIWNNALGQGNTAAIAELRQVLREHRLRFQHLKYVPNRVNLHAVRLSRVAPAIAGQWQVDHDYLPCRMFKNISYGCVGFSNVRWFAEVLPGATLAGDSIADLVGNALALDSRRARQLVHAQQQLVAKHTYVHKLRNILRALER